MVPQVTRTEEDLVTSLENRVRGLTRTVEAQQQLLEQQAVLLEVRDRQIEYLKSSVELLCLPRRTDADLQLVADGLTVLLQEKGRVQ